MEILYTKVPESINQTLSRISPLSALNAAVAFTVVWTFVKLVGMSYGRVRTTELRGPPSPSFLFGVGKILLEAADPTPLYESWAKECGAVFQVPWTLGSRRIVLCDPKALAHFHAKETWTYAQTPMIRKSIEYTFGRGLLWAEGESHKRQRKSLTPGFSLSAIRKLMPIFYNSAYKTKASWDALIESSSRDGITIDVQNWMNYISLDTIGLAGFSHDFGALDGKKALVTQIFDTFNSSSSAFAFDAGLNVLAQVFPFLMHVPTPRMRLVWKLSAALGEISNILLARTKKELRMRVSEDKQEKSIIGLLIKGESAESGFHLSKEEMVAQMNVLVLAGYETTATSMTWSLIELARNPDIQTKLRNELLEHDSDPTYDELTNGFPYLNAVVHEVLRVHAPLLETMRIAVEDDVIPLSEPLRTKSGQLVENLSIAKGTYIVSPLAAINISSAIWGEDAKVFKPDRWLEDCSGQSGIPPRAREVQGHRHLLTFSDGPRICIGRHFALAEFKAVMSVLIKNYVFELPDGPDAKFELVRGFLFRPRAVGEEGCKVPLVVKPYLG